MKIIIGVLKFIKNLVLFILFLALTILCFQQIQTEIYDFPNPGSFKGDHLYNPYKDLKWKWFKANFHAHSIVIKHVLNGKDTPEEVVAHYESRNYDVIGLSNYHHIASEDLYKGKVYIPVYEHGHNIMKSHRLVIGAKEVSFYDCLINYSRSNKQYIINRLQPDCDALAIAHPKFRNGHTVEDFRYLTGYDLIEVLNHYRFSFEHWDSALSSGIPAWIISDDDTHNVNRPEETCVNWTMINSEKLDRSSILENLKQGFAYGVTGSEGENKNYIDTVFVEDQKVTFRFTKKADEINLFGNNGEKRFSVADTNEISYTFKPSDSYIRTEVINDKTKMYLNPVVRYDGKNVPVNKMKAEVNLLLTYLMKFGVGALYLLIIFTWIKRRVRKKRNKNK
ncbi:MAG: hypothetical protein ACEPO8_06960 [Rhodothermaceae bacterium]